MPLITLDHLVVPVDDVDSAGAAWSAAGHDVRAGGRHGHVPTQNVLIPVADGTYIELLGPVRTTWPPRLRRLWQASRWDRVARRRSAVATRFLRLLASSDTPADACLSVTPLAATVDAARAAGLEVSDPIPMERVRPDGQRPAWALAVPSSPDLPFAIEDRTNRDLRVPAISSTHAGLTLVRTRRLRLAVRDRADARRRFAAWLSREPAGTPDEPTFVLDDGCEVRLVESGFDGPVGLVDAEYDARRGARPTIWRLAGELRHA